MRLKLAVLVMIGVIASALFAGTSSSAGPLDPEIITPRLTPTPSPGPTPVPTPTPKPKPKPPPDTSKPDNSGRGRRVVYSNPKQRVWLIDSKAE